MIKGFPLPFEGELLYSVIARYWQRVQYPNLKDFTDSLFSNQNSTTIVDFPTHLQALRDNIHPDYPISSQDFLYRHTLFPAFAPFLAKQQAKDCYQGMMAKKAIHHRIGMVASGIKSPLYLRYCPDCIEADRKQYGEAFWHRIHQMPGVLVCPHHAKALYSSDIRAFQKRSRYLYVHLDMLSVIKKASHQIQDVDRHQQLAQGIGLLLDNIFPSQGLKKLQQKYQYLLAKRSLATYSGRMYMSKLVSALREAYGDHFLQQVYSPLKQDEDTWLHKLVRQPRASQHPIRHLLLIHFLGLDVKAFFRLTIPLPFGRAPYPCLNPVAEHYQRATISSITMRYSLQGKPIGTFACPLCDYTYERTGPDITTQDSFVKHRVKNYGVLWHQQLHALNSEGKLSLRAKARYLGVTPKTVTRYSQQKEVTFINALGTTYTVDDTVKHDIARQQQCRNQWLKLQKTYYSETKTQLRKRCPEIYMWLYRHDRQWLDIHSPACKRPKPEQDKVDWQTRDDTIAAAIAAAYDAILAEQTKPVRITKTLLARKAAYLAMIEKHATSIPKAMAMLVSRIETRQEYALRKIAWLMKCYQDERTIPKLWQFQRRLSIRPDLLEMQVVRDAVTRALDSLESIHVT